MERFNIHRKELVQAGKFFGSFLIFFILISCGSKEQSSQDLQRDSLMKLVFKEWKADGKNTIVSAKYLKINKEYSHGEDMDLQPLQVVRLSDARAVLLVKIAPLSPGHSSQGLLGAYWFKRDGQKWFFDARQDEVEWLGSSGDFGKTTVLELYPKHYGLLVEYRWAGMGEDNTWANLYRLDDRKVTALFGESVNFLLAKAYGLGEECDESRDHTSKPKSQITMYDRDPEPRNCFNITAKWKLKPGKSEPGDFELESASKVSLYKETSRDDADLDNVKVSYKLISTTDRNIQVFHYDATTGVYKLIRGKSPIPSWYGG